MIVASIVGAPDARGIHRRAIVQSGSGTTAFTPEQAEIVTAAVGRELAIDPTAAGLGDVSDERLVDLMPRLAELDLATPDVHDPLGGLTRFGVVLDRQPVDAVAENGTASTELLIGSSGTSVRASIRSTPPRWSCRRPTHH